MSNCFRDNTNASSVVDNENWMLDARVNIKIGQTSRSPYQARSIERGMTEMQMEYSRIGRPRLITYRDNCSSAPERPERNKPPMIDLIVQKWQLNSYAGRTEAGGKEREKDQRGEKDVYVDSQRDAKARCEYIQRVYTNEVDGVREGAPFPSVSATSERGREITGTRDRRIG